MEDAMLDIKNIIESITDKFVENTESEEIKQLFSEKDMGKRRDLFVSFLKGMNENPNLVERYSNNINEKTSLDREISQLDEESQKEFWVKYHGVLEQTEINDKLDVVLNSISELNSNIISNFNMEEKLDDILGEIQILRKELKSQ